uniref:CCHC-type domain-containing protein n=1 Tax=Aegilops tauschii subsp. strangulata TaxID=200361 RepID=A0A453AJP6_AEGTS
MNGAWAVWFYATRTNGTAISISSFQYAKTGSSADSRGARVEGSKETTKKKETGNSKELFCVNCKEQGHMKSDCKNKIFCVVCQRPSHNTKECTVLKQVKPVAKYVRGLGCLLVQNTKDIVAAEHINPMALVTVHEGQLNDTTVAYGFSKMFDWGWTWRAKFQSPKTFLMRFPSKPSWWSLKTLASSPCLA